MISTENYLASVAPKQTFSTRGGIFIRDKAEEWIHDHPKTVAITRIALDILSLCAIAATPIVWGVTGVVPGVVGLIGLLATEFVHRKLAQNGILATPIGTHVFQEGKVEGGRLYTQGKIPILELDMENPYKAGRAQGKLLAYEILQVLRRVAQEANFRKSEEVQNNLEQLKKQIPSDYLYEMRGLVNGINSWMDAQPFYRNLEKVTLEELLFYNLMPDSLSYDPIFEDLTLRPFNEIAKTGFSEEEDSPSANLACTVVIDKNERSGLVFGRNMDWPSSLGAGKYSLIINRKYKENATVEVGVPGILGTLTGMNRHGLSLSMNTCELEIIKKGMPACFYNRMVLEQCQNVEQTREFVDQHNPLSSYHLSVADEERAESYHFYQGKEPEKKKALSNHLRSESYSEYEWNDSSSSAPSKDPVRHHVHRKLSEEGPLVTTNCVYDSPDSEDSHVYSSKRRKQNIMGLFDHAVKHVNREEQDLEALVAYSLRLPYVNNGDTTHSVEMVPHKRLLRVSFDNSFAASHPLQELDARPLLSR